MRIFDDLRSGLAPSVEELRGSWDREYAEPLRGRERLAEAVGAGAFLATAVAMAVFIPAGRAFDVPLEDAVDEFQAAGTQFNPAVVAALMCVLTADPLAAGARGPRVAAVA